MALLVTVADARFGRVAPYFVALRVDDGDKARTEICAPSKTPRFEERSHLFPLDLPRDAQGAAPHRCPLASPPHAPAQVSAPRWTSLALR